MQISGSSVGQSCAFAVEKRPWQSGKTAMAVFAFHNKERRRGRGMEREAQEKPRQYAFFQHRTCEYFPCHPGVPEEEFNCLFCYCPLYALGENCGGKFTFTRRGIKNCTACTVPHWRKNYSAILRKIGEVQRLAAGGRTQNGNAE